MIKTGDKEKLYKRELIDELINELRNAVLTGGTIYLLDKFVTALNMHEQQKQRADELEDVIKRYHDEALREIKRADELEKRWSELVDVLKKKYEYYKDRADDESVGPIEQGKWKIAKHEVMMVLKIMTDLKRGETE